MGGPGETRKRVVRVDYVKHPSNQNTTLKKQYCLAFGVIMDAF